MDIFEVLEYGPVVAQDEELGLLITVNGSYFNLWVSRGDGQFENTDCRSVGNDFDGLHGLEIIDLMSRAKDYLADVTLKSEAEL